jgi:tetratricopeptide (TPR) repeat protein
MPAGELPLADPGERPRMLAQLYDQLSSAASADAAEPIIEAIEQVWRISGSDTVDLLMQRADNFVKQADTDMALQVLDSSIEIAPEDAEGWHQRSMVHFLRQDYQRSLADLRCALALDPGIIRPSMALAWSYRR